MFKVFGNLIIFFGNFTMFFRQFNIFPLFLFALWGEDVEQMAFRLAQ
jgi:hypothetical protein